MTDPRFPIGKFSYSMPVAPPDRARFLRDMSELAGTLRMLIVGLDYDELSRSYRPRGWTISQIVHHLADSHVHGFVRFKLAISADHPTIIGYDENRWVELADVRDTHPDVSVALLEALHHRWVALARSLSETDFARGYYHPEYERTISLDEALAKCAWHGRHHAEHIRIAIASAVNART